MSTFRIKIFWSTLVDQNVDFFIILCKKWVKKSAKMSVEQMAGAFCRFTCWSTHIVRKCTSIHAFYPSETVWSYLIRLWKYFIEKSHKNVDFGLILACILAYFYHIWRFFYFLKHYSWNGEMIKHDDRYYRLISLFTVRFFQMTFSQRLLTILWVSVCANYEAHYVQMANMRKAFWMYPCDSHEFICIETESCVSNMLLCAFLSEIDCSIGWSDLYWISHIGHLYVICFIICTDADP